MAELLHYEFMQRALLAGAIIGTVCAVVGVYVVLRGIAFIGAGISHAAFGGVALGLLLGLPPVGAAVVFCLGVAWAIGLVARRGEMKEDTAVGVFFAATMAMGVLCIGLMHTYQIDLFGYLFGSILAISTADVITSAVLGAVVLITVGLLYKELLCISFDPEMAEVLGIPAGKVHLALLSLVALTVVLSMKVVGIILVSALIVTPAAAAYQLTERFPRMMVLAVLIGVASTTGGLLLSYRLNTGSGATIVLVSTAIFLLAVMLSPRRRRARRVRSDLDKSSLAR